MPDDAGGGRLFRPASQAQPQPHFVEDSTSVTLDSGSAVCRFVTEQGGRLQRWQWRTVPPAQAANPATRHNPPLPLELVNPSRGALIDHFLPLGTKPGEIETGTHREYGDFTDEPFRSQVVDLGGELRAALVRDGEIRAGKRVAEVRLMKSAAVRPHAADIAVLYRIINSSLRPLQILFAVEFNLYAPGLYSRVPESDGYFLIDGERPNDAVLGSAGVSPNATLVTLVNGSGEMALQVGWDRECDLWRMSPGQDEAGARLLAVWRIQLPPRDNWAMGLWLAPS